MIFWKVSGSVRVLRVGAAVDFIDRELLGSKERRRTA